MKTDLQIRAENAASKFTKASRKPIVVEFAGVPKAGKTSTLTQVQSFLKRCGFRTEVVVERASICPIRDKKHSNFNVWTACTTLAQILEKTQDPPHIDDPHILILDRGIFDSICWLTMMDRLARIRNSDRENIERFLLADEWRKRISAVILMIVTPKEAMQRERGVLPIEQVKEGSIMNLDILDQFKKASLECKDRFSNLFRIYKIDTSCGDAKDNLRRTAENCIDMILSLVEEQITEEILCVEKFRVKELFKGKNFLYSSDTRNLISMFLDFGDFKPRKDVEENEELVQAIPIVIVRNASGQVLRLRRREKEKENPLHEKIVIWAGGHVRREDENNGNPLIQCAIREIKEELRLNIESQSLRSTGAVYFDEGNSTAKHVGIVYEWQAETDDVAVALSNAEFFERIGTSLSGSFISVKELSDDINRKKVEELWSVTLVHKYLSDNDLNRKPSLF